MADLIHREALRNALYDADAITMKGVSILNGFPAVDAVPVVRCKDCKHYRDWGNGNLVCWNWTDTWDAATEPDGFCSYGERRADNG